MHVYERIDLVWDLSGLEELTLNNVHNYNMSSLVLRKFGKDFQNLRELRLMTERLGKRTLSKFADRLALEGAIAEFTKFEVLEIPLLMRLPSNPSLRVLKICDLREIQTQPWGIQRLPFEVLGSIKRACPLLSELDIGVGVKWDKVSGSKCPATYETFNFYASIAHLPHFPTRSCLDLKLTRSSISTSTF